MTRRELLAASAAVTQLRGAPLSSPTSKRPNFLFILADDHAGYALGADGNPLASTPNLDALAKQGTRFAGHYCNAPVCTASRQSFLTGQLPHAAGVTRLPTPLDAGKPTLAKQFQAAGYKTAVFGKMHFNRPAEAGLHGFDVMMTENELTRAWQKDVQPKPLPADLRVKPQWKPFQDPARIWLNSEKLPFGRSLGEMRSTYLANQAAKYLEEHRGEPFALWTSFQEPHSPYDFPVEYTNRLSPSRYPAPAVAASDSWQIPNIFRDLSPEEKAGIRAAYYTSAAFLDHNVGRVLNAVKKLGLEDNTYVVYMADHGYCLGEHGRFEKHCGYDQALRVPLIMRWPKRIRAGVVSDFTEHIDVPATITDMMGLEPLAVQHGHTLRPYLEGRRPVMVRNHIFSEYLENEEAYIRTKEYKYMFCSGRRKRTDGYETDNPTPGRYERLYNLTKDPGEVDNVVTQETDAASRLRQMLLDRFRATHPDAPQEPQRLAVAEALDWYVRPRD